MWYSNEEVVVMLSVGNCVIHLGAPTPDEGIDN
jgi:hypothetical protein